MFTNPTSEDFPQLTQPNPSFHYHTWLIPLFFSRSISHCFSPSLLSLTPIDHWRLRRRGGYRFRSAPGGLISFCYLVMQPRLSRLVNTHTHTQVSPYVLQATSECLVRFQRGVCEKKDTRYGSCAANRTGRHYRTVAAVSCDGILLHILYMHRIASSDWSTASLLPWRWARSHLQIDSTGTLWQRQLILCAFPVCVTVIC